MQETQANKRILPHVMSARKRSIWE